MELPRWHGLEAETVVVDPVDALPSIDPSIEMERRCQEDLDLSLERLALATPSGVAPAQLLEAGWAD